MKNFSFALPQDSTEKDSLVPKQEEAWLQSVLNYSATDSIKGNMVSNQAYLYNEAFVEYEDTKLNAGYIVIDWQTNTVSASGILDSSGNVVQTPIFVQDGKTYEVESIVYNFKSEKAIIKSVHTKEGESFVATQKIKRASAEVFYMSDASFTTCSHKIPHYQVRTKKAKVIVGKQIVTGPAYVEIAGIPTPLVLPFGFFPAQDRRASGFIFPTFDINSSGNGVNPGKGMGLLNGGYYWAASEFFDLRVTGDLYTRGSWGIRTQSNYIKRYKYRGLFNVRYNVTKIGDPRYETYGGFQNSNDFRINWTHTQDPKANPELRFNANVNFATFNYNKFNTKNANDYLQSTMTSSISVDKNWAGTPFSMTISANHNQNSQNGDLEISLPKLAFNMSRVMPFERKQKVGDQSWYERIGVVYSLSGENRFSGNISDFDTISKVTSALQYGLRNNISVSTNEKVLKYWSLTPSLNYVARMYPNRLDYSFNADSNQVYTDTVNGFQLVQNFDARLGLSSKVYGMFKFKRGKLKAIRHVMTPGISVSYSPDFGEQKWGYYQTFTDTMGNQRTYNRYSGYLYGGPSAGTSGSVGLSLNNILEGKMSSDKDSTGIKKFKILERLNFNTSYNIGAKEFAWSNVSLVAATKFFNGKMGVTYQGSFDPYGRDSVGNRVNKSAYEVNKKLFWNRLNTFTVDFPLKGKAENKDEKSTSAIGLTSGDIDYYQVNDYAAFSVPWSLNLRYSYNSGLQGLDLTTQTHSIGFVASVDPTPNWHLNVTTGWDIFRKDISYTTVDLTRDIHCWEFHLTWVPFGFNQSYNIGIRIKASQFKDIKYDQYKGVGDF